MMLAAPADFRFQTAVCSYGFSVLAPNRWDAREQALYTVVPDDEGGTWALRIDSPRDGVVRVRVPGGRPSAGPGAAIRRGVRRILRLDEDLSGFHGLCVRHRELGGAVERGFGRLFRSPTLFEDIVKIICTCNITWRQTTAIVEALVGQYGAAAENDPAARCFPSAARLASVRVSELRNRCKLGYRAAYVSELARNAVNGGLDLSSYEGDGVSSEALYRKLRGIKGVGDYAAGNLLMLLGHYDRLAIDTYMVSHFRKHYPRRRPTPANMRRHYEAFQPYAFLAYWYELWSDYVETHGPPTEWTEGQGAPA